MMELLLAMVCSNITILGPSIFPQVPSFQNVTVYLYGVSTGTPCLRERAFLEKLELYGLKLIWIPLDKVKPNMTKPLEIVSSLGVLKVPISAVYVNGSLRAIVVGDVENVTFWEQITKKKYDGVAVYLGQKLIKVWKGGEAFPFSALALALLDGMGPIALLVFSLYMALCKQVVGNCLVRGALFVASAAFARAAMGFALSSMPASQLYPIIGAAFALIIFINSIKPTKTVTRFTSKMISFFEGLAKSVASPILLGLAVGSAALSPCVLGAFLSASAVANSLSPYQRLSFWLSYSVLYSRPFIVVAKLIEKVEMRKLVAALALISFIVSTYFTITYSLPKAH